MTSRLLKEEKSFMAGRRERWQEFRYTLGVFHQFITGLREFHFIGPCITVFGSARFDENHMYYKQAREVSAVVSKLGFTIMTGGGPGIMEAANRGARDAGGLSIGCNIVLPMEQQENPYLDKFINIDYFFVRKELLRKYSFAFIVMPGGFGTLDEFFETVTLIQTKKIHTFPIIVMGVEWHRELMDHIKRMAEAGTINEEDMDLILFTDSVEEAEKHIKKWADKNPELISNAIRKPIWWLGEKAVNPKKQIV